MPQLQQQIDLVRNGNNPITRIDVGKIEAVDRKERTLSVVTSTGRRLENVRQLVPYVTNDGRGMFTLPEHNTSCIVVSVTQGLMSDSFIVGYFQDFDEDGLFSNKNKVMIIGDQGFITSPNHYVIVRKSGAVEIKAGPLCQTIYKPQSGTILNIARQIEFYRDQFNHFTFNEKDNRVTFDLSVHGDLRNMNDNPPLDPQIVFRAGKTRHPLSSQNMYEEFDDDSLIKAVVKSYSPDGADELSRVILGVGKVDDKTSLRLNIDDFESNSTVGATFGKQEDGKIASIDIKGGVNGSDYEHATTISAGKEEDGSILNLSVDDTVEKNTTAISIGKKDDGSILNLAVDDEDEDNHLSVKIGSLDDENVIAVDVNEKAQIFINKNGQFVGQNKKASIIVDEQGNIKVENENSSAFMNSDGTVKMNGSGGMIKLSGDKVGIGSSSVELLDQIVQAISAILDNGSSLVLTAQGPGQINPTLKASLETIKTSITNIKGGI